MIARLSDAWRLAASAPVWWLVGLGLGFAIAPGGVSDWAYGVYDSMHPVVIGEGQLVSSTGKEIVVTIRGEKLRGCAYLAATAYSVARGVMSDVNLERVDRPQTHNTRPVGLFDAGTWRVWPVEGAEAVEVHFTYNCDSRVLVQRVARVAIR